MIDNFWEQKGEGGLTMYQELNAPMHVDEPVECTAVESELNVPMHDEPVQCTAVESSDTDSSTGTDTDNTSDSSDSSSD